MGPRQRRSAKTFYLETTHDQARPHEVSLCSSERLSRKTAHVVDLCVGPTSCGRSVCVGDHGRQREATTQPPDLDLAMRTLARETTGGNGRPATRFGLGDAHSRPGDHGRQREATGVNGRQQSSHQIWTWQCAHSQGPTVWEPTVWEATVWEATVTWRQPWGRQQCGSLQSSHQIWTWQSLQ